MMMNPECRMLGSKVTFQGEFGDRNTPGIYHMKRKTQTGTIFPQDQKLGERHTVPFLLGLGRKELTQPCKQSDLEFLLCRTANWFLLSKSLSLQSYVEINSNQLVCSINYVSLQLTL